MQHPVHRGTGGHHAGGRLGRFGRGFIDGGDTAGREFGMGRKLASVDLQLLILALLEVKPCHGYEIIKALEERSNGFYVPSPGMVYPALALIQELGHASIETDGMRKRYHLADAGRRHLDQHRPAADALFAQFERVADRMARVRRALNVEAIGAGAQREPPRRGSRNLLRARRELNWRSPTNGTAPPEEQQRIVGDSEARRGRHHPRVGGQPLTSV